MQEARIRWALAAIGLVIFGGSGAALYATRRSAPPPVVITMPPTVDRPPVPNSGEVRTQQAAPPQETPPAPPAPVQAPPAPVHKVAPTIYIHVAGAVKHPSLYTLAPGSRVMQAIKAAGGPTAKADLDAINLAEKVRDGEKVYVPVQQPQAAMVDPPGNTIGHASVIPADDIASDTAPSSETPTVSMAQPVKAAKHGGAGKADKLTSPEQGRVNLNTADAGQLQRLPGIGPAMAARILAYRQQAHGFQKVDELMEVGGIGPKKFAKISPLVKLN